MKHTTSVRAHLRKGKPVRQYMRTLMPKQLYDTSFIAMRKKILAYKKSGIFKADNTELDIGLSPTEEKGLSEEQAIASFKGITDAVKKEYFYIPPTAKTRIGNFVFKGNTITKE